MTSFSSEFIGPKSTGIYLNPFLSMTLQYQDTVTIHTSAISQEANIMLHGEFLVFTRRVADEPI